jgi:dTDP-4-amino-4,6-dideoxygalactose transaminase
MNVPLFNLWAQHRALAPALRRAFERCLRRSAFILGPTLEAFERAFARTAGAPAAVGVANGTDALRLCLAAESIGPGDEVIVPALTFAATAHAVVHAGARPVFVDVEPETATIDPRLVERAVTRRTRAIIPVHLYGHPANMSALRAVARRRGLILIEDACQAHGARWRGRPVGSLGDYAAFSFYPSKNLGALGDGGIIATNRARADRLRALRHVGQRVKNRHDVAGFNSRLDAMQAAFLMIKLRRLPAWNRARRRRAGWYRRLVRRADLRLPVERPGALHVYHLFIVRTPRRDALQATLTRAGIGSAVYYPTPVPYQPAMRPCGHRRGDFPVAEEICRTNLALPMYPELTRAQAAAVARAVNRS